MLGEYGIFCIVLDQRSNVSVTFGFIILKKQNNVSNSIGSSSSRAHEGRVSVAIRSVCQSNSNIGPFVHVVDFVVCYLVLTSKFGIIQRRKIYT